MLSKKNLGNMTNYEKTVASLIFAELQKAWRNQQPSRWYKDKSNTEIIFTPDVSSFSLETHSIKTYLQVQYK